MTEYQIEKMIIDDTNAEMLKNPDFKGMLVGPIFKAMAKALGKVIVKAIEERMDRIGMKDV